MSIMAIKYTSFLGAPANGKHMAVRMAFETPLSTRERLPEAQSVARTG